ncbi:hypothetical protein [Chryseobacterium luquanense]|uniref:Uncharacterized protein n=1 Tax=Chryseobacterium luquanense TaxID=2983766 RepID=A0ABT3Y142_9FLAO|nr:hypothetical protein [Chryseobacterium luquanense]MCX8531816.1 hypothetical protein [Chryseobacterium luquanense]
MSLTISFLYLSDGFNDLNLGTGSELFGFEICRKELWGNQKLKVLGCKIIPKLNESDLYIINGEFHEIYEDCQIILKNITEISLVTNYSEEFIKFRINNLLKFIEVALRNEDDLGINIS